MIDDDPETMTQTIIHIIVAIVFAATGIVLVYLAARPEQ